MTGFYTEDDFARMIRAEFPAQAYPTFATDLDSCDGLLHLEMHALCALAQGAKKAADWDSYRRVISLVDTLWRGSSGELLNALGVSFLEHLDFDGPRGPAAWELLSPLLQHEWRHLRAYMEKAALLGNPSLRNGKRRKKR